MIDLRKYRKMNIYFYGNEEEKQAFFRECVCPFFRRKMVNRYFATRDWNGGPNVEIIYAGDKVEKKLIKKAITEYCQNNNLSWTEKQLEENIANYKKNQEKLAYMEKKEKKEISRENHLKITDRMLEMPYYRRIYNSSRHVQVHFESRFLLQPLIEDTLVSLPDKKMQLLLVMKLFQITMQLFEQGEQYASLMYVSNIQGVLGIAKQYQKQTAFIQYFEEQYGRFELEQMDQLLPKDLVAGYTRAWQDIYQKCIELVSQGLEERGYYKLVDQEKQLKKNISTVESDFHQAMLRDKNLHNLITSSVHLTFRSIVNILYSCMPAMNITFMEKQLCCYVIVRYTLEKYKTNWEQLMKERVI